VERQEQYIMKQEGRGGSGVAEEGMGQACEKEDRPE